jgi:hypothetical protein
VRRGSPNPGQFEATHGASSPARIRPVARNAKRRFLRTLGLRAGDLLPWERAWLDTAARASAKAELMDAHAREHGWLGPDGTPPPFSRDYWAALRLRNESIQRLAESLSQRLDRRTDDLAAYLSSRVVEVEEAEVEDGASE